MPTHWSGEEVLTVCLEPLLGVTRLGHVDLVVAVGGMRAPAFQLADSQCLEVTDDALGVGLGHVLVVTWTARATRGDRRALAKERLIPIT